MSRFIGFAGIAVLVVSGVFALFGYTKISYFLLAVAAVDLMVARIYQPDESNDRRTKQLKAVSCFAILLGTLFIYITGSWIGIIAINSGIIDLMSGEYSILKKQPYKR
ncbi:hypothetical protein [Corynebacterium sp. LaCa142]|uniref:hypothetical protein n=1 Tax=Corynebacterium sp. LaCa142 TaxID=3391425 RepID=UPI0039893108